MWIDIDIDDLIKEIRKNYDVENIFTDSDIIYYASLKYPNGPCPVECPACEEHCCPKCGGKIDNHGCYRCDYRHCGGCL